MTTFLLVVAMIMCAYLLYIRSYVMAAASIVFCLCALYTKLMYKFFDMNQYLLTIYANAADIRMLDSYILYFTVSAILLCFPAIVLNALVPKQYDDRTVDITRFLPTSANRDVLILCYIILYIAFYMYSYGYELIERSGYVPQNRNDAIFSVVKLNMVIVAGLAALMRARWLGFVLILVVTALEYAASSRGAALALATFAISSWMFWRTSKLENLGLVLLVIILHSAVLQSRSLPLQGLLPNAVVFGDLPKFLTYVMESANYLFIAGVGASAYADGLGLVREEDFFGMIDPRPSFLVGDQVQFFDNRINDSAPVPGIAQIYGSGLSYGLFTMTFVGVLGWVFSELMARYNKGASLILSLIYLVGLLMATQYNLRTFSRFMIYPLVFCLFYWAWSSLYSARVNWKSKKNSRRY